MIWSGLLDYVLDHWMVLVAFALITAVAVIYVLMKD